MSSLWLKVRYNFWVLPAAIVVVAIVIAGVLVETEGLLRGSVLAQWPRLFGAGAEGSRGLLSTIASSMVTIAGVVFSITLVALSFAANQYSPALLRNFMSDRVNQFVLGTFVGIFAYCLVVLRTIRGADEGLFVPTAAVLVGLILGLVGIAVLIYFIHHIANAIQPSHILAAVTVETLRSIDAAFPQRGGEDDVAADDQPSDAPPWHLIPADSTGYLQTADRDRLIEFARSHGTVLRTERQIGEFVIKGEPILAVRGAAPDEEEQRRVASIFTIARQRTIEQDPGFGIRQIVDLALKALSSAMNDTTIAVMCIDRLTSILVRLSDKSVQSHFRDDDGTVRVIMRGPTYADVVSQSFDQIREHAGGNVAVLEALLGAIEQLVTRQADPARRSVLLEQVVAIEEQVKQTVSVPRDLRRVSAFVLRTRSALERPPWRRGSRRPPVARTAHAD